MYTETLHQLGEQSALKLAVQKKSLAGHLIRSAMAGMYVGAAIVLIFTLVEKKMNLPAEQLVRRALLPNWMVCLAVWMGARTRSDTARILLIWWCMFTFITSGYEHSIANMCGLLLGLLLPHGPAIS